MLTRTTKPNGNRYYEDDGVRYPSVTGILRYYPKGEGFYRWLMMVGNRANHIRDTAGDKGHKIHKAVENYLYNKDFEYDIETTKYLEQFRKWFENNNIKVIDTEKFVVNKTIGYAGTIDLILKINGQLYIVDIKSSNYLYASHRLQLSAYKHCGYETAKLALLHLKEDSYDFIDTDDNFDVFLAVKKIFDFENK